MAIPLQNLQPMIASLCEGLDNEEARDRLTKGVLYSQCIEAQKLPAKEFNKTVIPIFAFTVHAGHRFDIPVTQYLDELVLAIDTHIDKLIIDRDITNSIDVEEAYLKDLARRFMRHLDA